MSLDLYLSLQCIICCVNSPVSATAAGFVDVPLVGRCTARCVEPSIYLNGRCVCDFKGIITYLSEMVLKGGALCVEEGRG